MTCFMTCHSIILSDFQALVAISGSVTSFPVMNISFRRVLYENRYLLTYLLTPWSRVLEKLTGSQLGKKFPLFYGTQRFITANLVFVGPCIVLYFYSKTNQMHNISNLFYFGTTLYMFRRVSPSIIRSLILYTQHQVYAIETEPVWHIPDVVGAVLDSWWWTERPSETCRVLFQNKINLRHCASCWFYYRNISLQRLQETATCPCNEPDQSSLRPPTALPDERTYKMCNKHHSCRVLN